MRAWTDDEKKWYGIGIGVDGQGAGTWSNPASPNGEKVDGYDWSGTAVRDITSPPNEGRYGDLGLGSITRALGRKLANDCNRPFKYYWG